MVADGPGTSQFASRWTIGEVTEACDRTAFQAGVSGLRIVTYDMQRGYREIAHNS